jgi:hypothetical protein
MAGLASKLEGLEVLVKELAPQGGEGTEDDEAGEELEKQQQTVRWALGAPERLSDLEGEEKEKEWVQVKRLLDEWHGVEGVAELSNACMLALHRGHREDLGGPDG